MLSDGLLGFDQQFDLQFDVIPPFSQNLQEYEQKRLEHQQLLELKTV